MAAISKEPIRVKTFRGKGGCHADEGASIFGVAIAGGLLPSADSLRLLPMAEAWLRPVFLRLLKGSVACALACACLYSQEPPRSDAPPLPLAETLFPQLAPLLQKAIQQSPQTIQSNLEFLIAQENVQIARSRQRPQAGGYLTYSYGQDRRADRVDPLNVDKLFYHFSVTQPVYHWGALRAGIQLSKVAAQLAENNFAEGCRLLLLEVRAAYLRLVVLKATRDRAAFALRLAVQEERVAEEQLQAGAIAPAEMTAPRTKVTQLTLDAERAEEEYRLALLSLERLAGGGRLDETSIPGLVPDVPYSPEQIKAWAGRYREDPEQGNFRLASVQLRLDQEKLNYQIIDKNLRPKLNLVTGVSQDEVSYTGSPADRANTQSIYAGVNVTWNIFDGYSTPAQRRASRLRQRQLETERDGRRKELTDAVEAQVKQIDFAARTKALGQATLDQYNLFVKKKGEDVAYGIAAPSELDDARISRDAVLIQAMMQRSDLLGRLAEFLSSIGRDPALGSISSSPP